VKIADSAMRGIPEPDAATVEKFHKDNAARFTAPEYRTLTVADLRAADLAAEIAVSEEALKEAYDAREAEFNQPEKRKVEQIVFEDEAAAKRGHDMLTQNRDFAEVAKEVAGMDASTLDIGIITRQQLLPELADAVFNLSKDSFSKPTPSPLGWHIIRVTAVEPARLRSLNEVRDILKADVAKEKAIDAMFALANKLEDELGGGATLEEAARSLNLNIRTFSGVDATGRDQAGNPVKDLPQGGKFLSTAFLVLEGEESVLTEAGTDGYFVLRVDKITWPALRPLDSVRTDVIAAWKAQERSAKAKKAAEELLEQVRKGGNLAGKQGLKIVTTPAMTRFRGEHDVPPALVKKLFDLKPGQSEMGRGADGYTVATLKDIKEISPSSDREGVEAIVEEIGQSLRGDLLGQLARALRGSFPVVVNEKAMERFIQ
jgi:peptidyl-prolyl cis-trans isomerase D